MSELCVVAAGRAFQVTNPAAFRVTAQTFADYARRFSPALPKTSSLEQLQAVAGGGALGNAKNQHDAVCAFLDCLKDAARQGANAETYLFVTKCAEFDRYIDKLTLDYRANSRSNWAPQGVKSDSNAALAQAIGEIVSHMQAFADPVQLYASLRAYTQGRLDALLPLEIASMQQEANIALILPFFEKALAVPGDAAEFGCFRGILSVKLAWLMKAVGVQKHYYTFDTFHGFEIDDPAGGPLGVGSFRDDAFNAYGFLTKWARVLPLTPVKGDATRTCTTLTKPLSFVWLDLDMDVLMDPVLRQIWHLCGPDTVIGVDDVGRPQTPTVGPWLERLVVAGALEVVFNSDEAAPDTCIRFLKKKGTLPASR